MGRNGRSTERIPEKMRKKKVVIVLVCVLVACCVWLTTSRHTPVDKDALIAAGERYDTTILRDTWGVPHIFGKTDADAAYGLAYVHCEDDWDTIQDILVATRGRLAAVKGKDSAAMDYMVRLLRIWDTVDAKYDTDLSPEVRAICEAYADGANHYAALHSDKVWPDTLPVTGKDIVAGFAFRLPLFFGLDGRVKELFGSKRRRSVSEKQTASAYRTFLTDDLVIGSNAFAVGPTRTANGETFLNINSHQPWEGPVAWYEAHVHSEEGWDMVGGTFPGSPLLFLGHNRHLGWAHTVNSPDLVDIYVLDINPDNPNQYKFDGAWRDLEVGTARMKVKIWGPITWTVKRETLYSVYGPTARTDHGVYAIRWAGMGDIRAVEQWFRMGKATTLAEWQDAMRMRAIPSLNCLYADNEGNVYYVYNALLPIRVEGYDWEEYLPGDTSETLWTEFLPFDDLPQVLNPPSGFVISCNNSPFRATTGPGNADPEKSSPTLGIETHMTNRALRALELFGADESITEEEFYAYKYDMHYSTKSKVGKAFKKLISATPPEDPLTRDAFELLKTWDLGVDPDNRAAALAVFTLGPDPNGNHTGGRVDAMMKLLGENARALKKAHGRIDVPWGDINRLYRGTVNLPIGGGPDVLHAVYGFRLKDGALDGLENGEINGRAGDCLVHLVTWDKDGSLHSRSIHQYGSATLDATSPHYADQTHLFVKRETKPVWMDEADIRANLGREYRPGKE